MPTLWEKSTRPLDAIERFTVGHDRELDLYLAPYDVLGSIAHTTMLGAVGLLPAADLDVLLPELRAIYRDAVEGRFVIEEGVEDVHSQVELLLTRRLGEAGKKIHSGRSRNDQVLVDLKLFTRDALRRTADAVVRLFDELQRQSRRHASVLMPGYTHLQVAMPSSFGLWFGAYAESLCDDMLLVEAAYRTANRNPLGSAAGYGSSFPLDRTMTTRLLGFDTPAYNSVYAQMGRGKTERNVAFALASIASTVSKLAYDACLLNSQNFAFIRLPDECTTGSSIMPHKNNPDVFEPSGYFRDLQEIKEQFLPAFDTLIDCLDMATYIVQRIEVRTDITDEARYDLMFSVEEVNRRVLAGVPFRDAYKQVGLEIEAGTFRPDRHVHHTHEGSIGRPCNDEVDALMHEVYNRIGFDRAAEAERKLAEG